MSNEETQIVEIAKNTTNETQNDLKNEEWKDIGSQRTVEIKCDKKPVLSCGIQDKLWILKTEDGRLSEFALTKFPKPELVSVKDIKVGNIFLEEVPEQLNHSREISYNYDTFSEKKVNILPLEPDLMRLIGYYLAEGSLTKNDKGSNGKKGIGKKRNRIYYKYRVDFSFNINETEYIDDVKVLIMKYFGVLCQVYKDRHGNGASITSNTRKGYEFFNQFFGRGASHKQIPEYFIHLDKELLKNLVKGFWRGDGSLSCDNINTKRKNNQIRRTFFNICSTSKVLTEQIRRVLLRLHINPSFCIRTPAQHHPCIVNGNLVKAKHDLNILSIYGKNAEIMNSVLDESYGNFSTKKYTFFTPDGKYALFPIKSVKVNE